VLYNIQDFTDTMTTMQQRQLQCMLIHLIRDIKFYWK